MHGQNNRSIPDYLGNLEQDFKTYLLTPENDHLIDACAESKKKLMKMIDKEKYIENPDIFRKDTLVNYVHYLSNCFGKGSLRDSVNSLIDSHIAVKYKDKKTLTYAILNTISWEFKVVESREGYNIECVYWSLFDEQKRDISNINHKVGDKFRILLHDNYALRSQHPKYKDPNEIKVLDCTDCSICMERNNTPKGTGNVYFFYDNGTIKQIKGFVNDELVNAKSFYPNGKMQFEYNYKNGKQEGIAKSWYESGKIKLENNYVQDKKEGIEKAWYESGKPKYESNYANGLLHGNMNLYYDNGTIKQIKGFVNDELVNAKSFYPNGKMQFEYNYKNGKQEGIAKSWYESGKIKLENNYVQDKKEGIEKAWYESGKPKYESNYTNGLENGKYRAWYESGKIEEEINYVNGLLHGKDIAWHETGEKWYEADCINDKGTVTVYERSGDIEFVSDFTEGKIQDAIHEGQDKIIKNLSFLLKSQYESKFGLILNDEEFQDIFKNKASIELKKKVILAVETKYGIRLPDKEKEAFYADINVNVQNFIIDILSKFK